MRVVRHRHRLPRKVVDALFLKMLQVRLYGNLDNSTQLKIPLLILELLDQIPSKCASEAKLSIP